MLSPGRWHKQIPKDVEENLKCRRYMLERAKTDRAFRRDLMAMCREDCLAWVNLFAWQFNPDRREVGPFITWDRAAWLAELPEQDTQEEAVRKILDAVEAREDTRWQKSREVGASWLVLLVIVWLCLFHANTKALAMSRDEDAVDDADDPDSLFWKVRFIHKHLPLWMRGPIKDRKIKDSRPGIRAKSNGFVYEKTHSYLTGTANVASAGVGGRATIALIDEFGQFKNGHETYSMTSDTANCRVFVFTHKDSSGMAYNLCFDPKYSAMRSIITHWTQHPVKGRGVYRYDEATNDVVLLDRSYQHPPDFRFVMEPRPTGGPFPCVRSPWYDRQCIRRTDRDVSMNLDIDPRGATERFFDSYRIRVLSNTHACDPYWRGTLRYDKETGRPLELSHDPQGMIRLWCQPRGPLLIAKGRFGAGADIAAGSGATPSCLSVISARTGEKVLEYANANIFQNDFAVFICALLQLFEDENGIHPLLGWEIQGGQVVDKKLRELGYSPCFVNRNEAVVGSPLDPKGRRGVSAKGEPVMALMNNYRDGLYEQRCINRSAFALEECLSFVYTSRGIEYQGKKKPGRPDEGSGATVHHGDLPKSDALAWKMAQELGFDRPPPKDNRDPDWIDPRTLDGRMKIHERREAAEEVWA